MKTNRSLFLVALTVMLILGLSGAAFAAGLSDINGHWAQKQIEEWVEQGLVAGYPDGTFKPDNSITRAEFVVLVNRAFSLNNDAECDFADVKTTDWFYEDVATAKAAGYISGYEDNTFRPTREISRQEAAVIVAKLLDLDTSEELDGLDKFVDADIIPSWAKASVNAVANAGIINGYPDKSFRGLNPITRAEAIVVLNAALGKVSDEQGIEGTVTYKNEAVKDAVIRVFEKDGYEVIEKAEADSDGNFKFELSPGEYDITAVTDEAIAYESDVEVTAVGGFVALELELEEAVIVSGKLNDKNNKPVKNTEIMFTTNPTFITTTDTNGNYKLAVLPDKEYTVRAVNPENDKIEVVEESVDVGSAKEQSIDTLKAPFAVSSSSGGGGGGGGSSKPSSSLDYEKVDEKTYNLSGRNDNPIGTRTFSIDSTLKVVDVKSNDDIKLCVYNDDKAKEIPEYIEDIVRKKITIEDNKVKLNNINRSYDELKVLLDEFAPDGNATKLEISVKDAENLGDWITFTFNLE
ncbi:S-layer homology domain-containing protein [Desulfolucanica intricata]|uniref:S-layer homology domain-containing protein n=1 Tax=Desulfolucanica intricata TaxID=1285191 RepID=UPI00082AA1C5|nr:S-layer homology domain-containing protein [Desulfolucanica intricata]